MVTLPADGAGRTRAVVVSSSAPTAVRDVELAPPGPGEALVDVTFSSVNYKDGMAMAGDPGVARIDPLVPGIDVVGRIGAIGGVGDVDDGAADPGFRVGDRVVLNGAGAGETRDGGFATQAIVPTGSLVALPDALPDDLAAAIGTAGFTAMLSVLALERLVGPDDGPVLVTGASGGVGTVAIALLAANGYTVTASTGRPQHADALRTLGAHDVLDRSEFTGPGRPMQRARWAGAVDSVGGATLVNVLAQLRWGGAATACGLVQDAALHGTVLPFVLRGVALLGVNSVDAPPALRRRAWDRLATDLDPALLRSVTTTVGLEDAIGVGERILAGAVHGRTVIRM
ncbi:MDR family oxidoreductase [Curtobacterium sp. RRHDQ10]|uniref:MDR family oxidoreductase n=1 Tax=Curtobacterium phyllosphaerae TaxID=3413379 RepID=UPI003BF0A29F